MNGNDSRDRARIVIACLSSLAVVSWIDWVTGYEFLFFVFYFVPVAICAWHLGRGATLGASCLCGIGWTVVDYLSGHRYSSEVYRYWNGFTCVLAFGILGVVLNDLRRSLRRLAEALDDLKRATEQVRQLQGQLQVVCAWTKRIKVDGKWVPLEEFLASKLDLRISHGISPEAFDEFTKSLK